MSRTGVDSLDRSIDKTNAWLADVAPASARGSLTAYGSRARGCTRCVTACPVLHRRAHRCPAARATARRVLRGLNPSKVPIKYGKDEHIDRFAKDAQIHHFRGASAPDGW